MVTYERVFYIGVAGIPPQDIALYMEEVKKNLTDLKKVGDRERAITNYFIPVRQADSRIEYYVLDYDIGDKQLVFPKEPALVGDINLTQPSQINNP